MRITALVVLVVLVAGSSHGVELDPEMAELAKVLRESCIGETGVDGSLIDKVNAGAELMPDPKLKCYMKCVMETAGMYGDGAMDIDAVVAILPDELKKHEDTFRACGTKPGTDDCDIVYQTQVCWQVSNKKDYFLF